MNELAEYRFVFWIAQVVSHMLESNLVLIDTIYDRYENIMKG